MTTHSELSTRHVVRTPEDLLAIAPVVIGFWPEESVVMLTFGAPRPFHARVDLPPLAEQTPDVLEGLAEALVEPAHRHGVQAIVMIYLTAEHAAASAAHRVLRRAAHAARIRVVTAVSADGSRYREMVGPFASSPGPAVAYDVSAHPFVVEALVSGRLEHPTRTHMVAALATDETAAAKVREALRTSGIAEDGPPYDGPTVRAHGCWVEELVRDGVRHGRAPSDVEAARLLWVMQSVRVRDAAWSLITASTATAHERWWTAVLARTPEELVPAPAILLGWSCWQAGNGARAWAAVDRCCAVDPGYSLAGHLSSILNNAVPPEIWEGGFDWTLGLPA